MFSLKTEPCASCAKPTDGLLRCLDCSSVYYCNSTCQRIHLKAHQPLCASMRIIGDPGMVFYATDQQVQMRLMCEAATGGTDAQLLAGYLFTFSAFIDSDLYASGIEFLNEALLKHHPAAPYVLGLLVEAGEGSIQMDTAYAAELYHAGFAATRHVGCAVRLYMMAEKGLPAGGEGLQAAEARLASLVAAPDILAVAVSTGSRSSLRDAVWAVAQTLAASADAAQDAGDSAEVDKLLMARMRVLEVGVEEGDAFITAIVAESLIAIKCGPGMSLIHHNARGEQLCTAVLADPRAPRLATSCASSMLGVLADTAGDHVAARQRFLFALEVCGETTKDISQWALTFLPRYLFEGLGGPADVQRAEQVLRLGCERKLGICLELAARRATSAGRMVEAASLWQRAADKNSVLAWSVVHGVTVEAAQEAIGCTVAVALRAAHAQGIEAALEPNDGAGGLPQSHHAALTRFTTDTANLADSLMLVCSCCGHLGTVDILAAAAAADAAAAAATAAAAAATSSADTAAGGTMVLAPALTLQQTAMSLQCEQVVEMSADRYTDGEGAAGSSVGSATAAAGGRVLAAAARASPPVLLYYCGRCKCALYCSRECQKKAWPEHKRVCCAPADGGVGK